MKNRFLMSAIIAASLALSSAANAVVVTETFTATVQSGTFTGTIGEGSFTYDNALITNMGSESLTPDDGLMVSFNVFGQSFTEADDIQIFDMPPFPSLNFLDGLIIELDFIVDEFSLLNPTSIDQEGVAAFSILSIFQVPTIFDPELGTQSGGGFTGELFVTEISPVPVPAAAWLFGSALLGFFGFSRRKKAA